MVKRTKIKVELIDYTGGTGPDPKWYAARLLAFTKSTRLQMDPTGFKKFLDMSENAIGDQLDYMVSTLPSSWEFVDATFLIQDVSRACAQQITRTRWSPMEGDIFGSYAMQAQRVVDVSDVGCYVPDGLPNAAREYYERSLERSMSEYSHMVEDNIPNEVARGLLPMHVASNLVVKFNLRALTDLCRKRSSMRVQGEYNEVVRQMREQVIEAWPWSEPFFEPKESIASKIIEEVAAELPKELRLKLAKAADLLKVG